MLGSLSHLGEGELVALVVAKEVIDGKCEGALEGCGGRHTCTEGHIACEGAVESLNGHAQLHHLAAYAEDEAEVSGRRALLVVEAELDIVLHIDGISAHLAALVGLNLHDNALLNGAGEYEAVVIVCMFTNQVNTSGGSVHISCRAVKVFDKTASNVIYL